MPVQFQVFLKSCIPRSLAEVHAWHVILGAKLPFCLNQGIAALQWFSPSEGSSPKSWWIWKTTRINSPSKKAAWSEKTKKKKSVPTKPCFLPTTPHKNTGITSLPRQKVQLFDTFWHPIFFKLEASENPTQKMKHNIKSQVFPKPHPNIPSVLRPLHLSCSWLSFRCFPAYGYRNPPTPQAENKVQDSSSYLNSLVPSPMMDWFFPPFFP